jgi:hypothetical protein
MSTLQEIKTAIAHLNAHDKALLAAELFAMNAENEKWGQSSLLTLGLRCRDSLNVKSLHRWRKKTRSDDGFCVVSKIRHAEYGLVARMEISRPPRRPSKPRAGLMHRSLLRPALAGLRRAKSGLR